MRARRVTIGLLAAVSFVAAACGTSEDSVSTTSSTSSATESSFQSAVSGVPATYLRFGSDGLVRVTGDDEQPLLDRPIGWASSDGAGGVLFTELDPDRFGPTWWLPGDGSDPVVVSEWDDPLIASRLAGEAAAVGALPTEGCEGVDAEVHMVARTLTTGETTTLQCGVAGQDAGRGPDSFGGGFYVGVEWNAVHHPGGYSTAIGLVFRDVSGEVIDHPANPYAEDCHPCELTAALSGDGTRLAVIHRPDAAPFRPDEYADWAAETISVVAELQVFDLGTGDEVFTRRLPAHTGPPFWSSWFDGRYVVLDVDPGTYPSLAVGDTGDGVRTLQRMLVEAGADIEVDGVFGPATQAAVEAFHTERFGAPRSWIGRDTWTELGAPNTIIDTHTGTTTALRGTVALEITLTDGPAPVPDGAPPQLSIGDQGSWVETLQHDLVRHGFVVEIDGIFGSATDAAVREFQSANGLTVDGIVGPETWAVLDSPPSTPPETAPVNPTEPTPAPPLEPPSAEPLVLAADGLGAVGFGDPADEVLAALTASLGPPDEYWRPNNPDGLVHIWGSQSPDYSLRVFTGTSTLFCGPDTYRDDGVDHFYAWDYRGGLGLTTSAGITIGSTAAELLAAYPDAEFGRYAETGSGDWSPMGVSIAGGALGLRGWVAYEDYEQIAAQTLVEFGFQVEPSSLDDEALAAFQASVGLELSGLNTPTWLALGLPLPADPDAPVTGLKAGIQDPS